MLKANSSAVFVAIEAIRAIGVGRFRFSARTATLITDETVQTKPG